MREKGRKKHEVGHKQKDEMGARQKEMGVWKEKKKS